MREREKELDRERERAQPVPPPTLCGPLGQGVLSASEAESTTL